MNEFEFDFQAPSHPPSSSTARTDNTHLGPTLTRLIKLWRKYHSRSFFNSLKSYVLRRFIALFQEQQLPVKKQNQQPQPVANEEQALEQEFVGMCAERIQAVFRGYLTRKYHRRALQKMKEFKARCMALVAGWKTRRILRSKKMKEEREVIRSKLSEIRKQEEAMSCSPAGSYNRKKLQYLKTSLKQQIGQFKARFQEFYKTGSWVFEPRDTVYHLVKPKTIRQKIVPIEQSEMKRREEENSQQTGKKTEKVRRVRQMRDRVKKSEKESPVQPSASQQPTQKDEEHKRNEVLMRPLPIISDNEKFEDRPITAKGAYSLTQLSQTTSQEKTQPNFSKSTEIEQFATQVKDNQEKGKDGDKNKREDKLRMEKRKKYDPRKAILEQKKRKQFALNKDQIPQLGGLKKQNCEKTDSLGAREEHILEEPPIDSAQNPKIENANEEKELQVREGKKSGKVSASNSDNPSRSTVHYPRGLKSKAEPKIDCWANRKTNKIKEEPKNSYKFIHASKEQEDVSKSVEKIKLPLVSQGQRGEKIAQGQFEPQLNQARRAEIVVRENSFPELKKMRNEYLAAKRTNDGSLEIRKTMSYQQTRKHYYQPSVESKRNDIRLKENHKCIDEIESVYNNHYRNRLQKLQPKLSFMAAARKKQKLGLIPVLLESSELVRKRVKQNSSTNRLWLTVSRIQKTFKDFDGPQ